MNIAHTHTCKYNQWYDEKKMPSETQIMMAKQQKKHCFLKMMKEEMHTNESTMEKNDSVVQKNMR